MRLTRATALLVAVLTLLPWAYIVYFTTVFIPKLTALAPQGGVVPNEFNHTFQMIFRVHLAMMLLALLLVAFYIVYLFRSDRVPADKKALWAVVLFLGNLLAMPVFWYFYMWPRKPGAA